MRAAVSKAVLLKDGAKSPSGGALSPPAGNSKVNSGKKTTSDRRKNSSVQRSSFVMLKLMSMQSRRRSSMADLSAKMYAKIYTAMTSTPEKQSSWEVYRLHLKTFLAVSTFGLLYEWLILVLGVATAFLYFVQTYTQLPSPSMLSESSGDPMYHIARNCFLLELCIAFIFFIDYCLNLFLSDQLVEDIIR